MGSIFEKSGCDALGYVIDDLLSVEKALNITKVAYLEYANCWGERILGSRQLGKDGYMDCVVFLANSMFENPSSIACFNLFGAMITAGLFKHVLK